MDIKIADNYVYRFYTESDQYQEQMVNYARMAKRFMNKPFNTPLAIVGNYEWHEQFPYENYLFYNWDTNEPLVDLANSCAVDFGCGPGRMINRAQKLFKKVDGIDISEYAIDHARATYPDSEFYVSSGVDVGGAPENFYDVAFSTIAIQHIPCKTIRENIIRGLESTLKPGGYLSIQVGFNPTIKAGPWSHDQEHASYDSDFWNAQATNGHADMVINEEDLPKVKADFEAIFDDVKFAMVNVDKIYGNLNGTYHPPYWASDWMFIQAKKRG
jgi:SAM-dependent methyltransferase